MYLVQVTEFFTPDCRLWLCTKHRYQYIQIVSDSRLFYFVISFFCYSESSMFVSKRRFILKTCGTTTPLLCLQSLMLLAEQYAGFTDVEDLFYSRKNYKRPELQVSPHQHFDQEVRKRKKCFTFIYRRSVAARGLFKWGFAQMFCKLIDLITSEAARQRFKLQSVRNLQKNILYKFSVQGVLQRHPCRH